MIGGVIKCVFAVILVLVVVMMINIPFEDPPSPKTEMDNISLQPVSANPEDFISVWDTKYLSEESEWKHRVTLPLEPNGTYDFIVNWGDDTTDIINTWDQSETTHTYSYGGVYTVIISGKIGEWTFDSYYERQKLSEISQWGSFQFGKTGRYFSECSNLELTASDAPNLEGVTSLYKAFSECRNLGSKGNMNTWNVSSVTNMAEMFRYASSFNQPLNAWDVSSVTTMENMFHGCKISTEFYDAMLVSWAQLPLQSKVSFDAGSSQYSLGAASTARQYIKSTFDWAISDGWAVSTVTWPNSSSTLTSTTQTTTDDETPLDKKELSGKTVGLLISSTGIAMFGIVTLVIRSRIIHRKNLEIKSRG